MAALTTQVRSSLGFHVRRLRLSQLLTQQRLADLASVSPQDVDSFEQGLPLPLDAKRRILKELWARKARE